MSDLCFQHEVFIDYWKQFFSPLVQYGLYFLKLSDTFSLIYKDNSLIYYPHSKFVHYTIIACNLSSFMCNNAVKKKSAIMHQIYIKSARELCLRNE